VSLNALGGNGQDRFIIRGDNSRWKAPTRIAKRFGILYVSAACEGKVPQFCHFLSVVESAPRDEEEARQQQLARFAELGEGIPAENRMVLERVRSIAPQRLCRPARCAALRRVSQRTRSVAGEQSTADRLCPCGPARQIHFWPDVELHTSPERLLTAAPAEFERFTRLGLMARAELTGQLATIASDEKVVQMTDERFYVVSLLPRG
jgi:hypothetical protein